MAIDTHRRELLEELEKARIYIVELSERLARRVVEQAELAALEERLARLEEVLEELGLGDEGRSP